jgi:hypothetical protein
LLWVVLSDARRFTTGVPEIRRSAFSGAERKTRRLACVPGMFIMVVSLCVGASTHVTLSSAPPDASPRSPAAAWSVARRYRSTGAASGSGQSLAVCQVLSASWRSTRGWSITSLAMPYSQRSNHLCRVSTHSARRRSNGSMCPARNSQSLRGTALAFRPAHQLAKWSMRTLSSCSPWTARTEAVTFPRPGR